MNSQLRVLDVFRNLPDYPQKKLDLQSCILTQCSSMDAAQYKRLKAKLKTEYERDAEKLESDYNRKVEALDTAWEIIQNDRVPTTMSIADTMREAISKLDQPFQSWQLYDRMKADYPEIADSLKMNTLSGHLTRMCKRGELVPVEKGSGTSPGTYRVVKLKERRSIQ